MDNREQIESLLKAGGRAKAKLYQDLIKRVANGDRLTATETKTMAVLERELSAEIGDPDPPELIQSFDDAAEYCGVSKRTIHYHVGKGNIRQNSDGTFERTELDAYLSKRGRKSKPADGAIDYEIEKIKADLRWRTARADREEMLNDELRGRLIDRDDVSQQWAARISEVTSSLEHLADRLTPAVVGKEREEISEIIRGEVWRMRDLYARTGKYCEVEGGE